MSHFLLLFAVVKQYLQQRNYTVRNSYKKKLSCNVTTKGNKVNQSLINIVYYTFNFCGIRDL